MTRIKISDDISFVVFKLASQVLDTLRSIWTATLAVHLAAKASRYQQRWDLLIRLGHFRDGPQDLLSHLIFEIGYITDGVVEGLGLIGSDVCLTQADMLLAQHELILRNLLNVLTLIEGIQLVTIFEERFLQVSHRRLLSQDRFFQILRLQFDLYLTHLIFNLVAAW